MYKYHSIEVIELIKEVKVGELLSVDGHRDELSELLVHVVEDGASIGFLPPLNFIEATNYWETVLNPGVILLVATINDRVVGSVQLHLGMKQNGRHRAEIAKLMTHPHYRRMGIGRALMLAAEERAEKEGRSLFVLDTREGDDSNFLYASLGYIQAGRIPEYAKSANGELHATIFYYKNHDNRS
jgi:ribosomal protein S18 acetylase RimI-like enzyme